ncbi:RING/U-box superfamily protein, partial [Prunus dulcis]
YTGFVIPRKQERPTLCSIYYPLVSSTALSIGRSFTLNFSPYTPEVFVSKLIIQLVSMSIQGSSEFQRWNVRDVAMGRIIDLDLNYPPPNENMALTGSLGLQVQGIGHYQGQATAAADFVDDEVVIISPRKFAEATNNSRRNPSRRSRRVIEGLSEGAEFYTRLSELTNFRAFSQLGASNWEVSVNVDVRNKPEYAATNVPMPPVVPQSEFLPESPGFTCAICIGQLIEETSTKCGHIFCKKCIEKAIATQHKCPTCRHKLRKRDILRIYLPNSS